MMSKFKFKLHPLVNYGIILILILLSVSLVRSIFKLLATRQKLEALKQDIRALEEKNKDLDQEVIRITSADFIEKQIRDNLGLAKEGEIVVVLPDDEVLRQLAPETEEEKASLPELNWQKWAHLFGF
jgi:cell division protein FtsB